MAASTNQYITRDRLDAAIAQLRTEMAQLRADIEKRFAEIEKRFAEQTRWIVGWMTGLVASATAIIIAVLR